MLTTLLTGLTPARSYTFVNGYPSGGTLAVLPTSTLTSAVGVGIPTDTKLKKPRAARARGLRVRMIVTPVSRGLGNGSRRVERLRRRSARVGRAWVEVRAAERVLREVPVGVLALLGLLAGREERLLALTAGAAIALQRLVEG